MAARPDRVGYQGRLGIPWLNRGTSQPPINLCRCGQELSKIGLGTSHHPKPETIFSKVGIGLAKNSDRLDSSPFYQSVCVLIQSDFSESGWEEHLEKQSNLEQKEQLVQV